MVLDDDLGREKGFWLAFRWDAVEKRPARGRVYIRAKRGDALTTSADFVNRNEPRLSQFFHCGLCSWSNKTDCPRFLECYLLNTGQ